MEVIWFTETLEWKTEEETIQKERLSNGSRKVIKEMTLLYPDAHKTRPLHDIKIQLKYEIDRYINCFEYFKLIIISEADEKGKISFKRRLRALLSKTL